MIISQGCTPITQTKISPEQEALQPSQNSCHLARCTMWNQKRTPHLSENHRNRTVVYFYPPSELVNLPIQTPAFVSPNSNSLPSFIEPLASATDPVMDPPNPVQSNESTHCLSKSIISGSAPKLSTPKTQQPGPDETLTSIMHTMTSS